MTYTNTSSFFIPVKSDWVKIYNILKWGEFLYLTQLSLKEEILDLIIDLNPKPFLFETYETVTSDSIDRILQARYSSRAKIEFFTSEEMLEAKLRLP